MELNLVNINGSTTGKKVNLTADVFGIEPNDHVMYLDVKQYLANLRQGTHKAKERNEVAGSTKKIKKQKGTGGARAGSIKSGTIIGGGRIFGPRPRDYFFKLNKKVKQLARKSALSYKAKDNKITVLEDFSFSAPKTKSYVSMLNSLNLSNNKTLLIVDETNTNVYFSGRNLPKAKVISVNEMSTYDLLNADTLLLTESSLKKLEEVTK